LILLFFFEKIIKTKRKIEIERGTVDLR